MLPEKQQEVLNFIHKYHDLNGIAPTLDEIASELKKSVPTIHQHVRALRSKGYLKMAGTSARNIGVFTSTEEIKEIPLLGYVSAGGGIENVENPEPIKVQKSLLSPNGEHFALIIKGTSMIDDGIFPDDIVIIKKQNYADNGDVVIALTGSSDNALATIKRYYNLGNKIELRPKNPELTARTYYPGEIEIRGKFVGLLRHG